MHMYGWMNGRVGGLYIQTNFRIGRRPIVSRSPAISNFFANFWSTVTIAALEVLKLVIHIFILSGLEPGITVDCESNTTQLP